MPRSTRPGLILLAGALCALVALGPLPLGAEGPPGIAFVQAPEQAAGVATGPDPARAFAAATDGCVEGGAAPEDCLPVAWCFPAGWSIDLFVMHVEGLHWHEVHCGLPDREAALEVADLLCDVSRRPWIADCLLVQMHDPEGMPRIDD